MNDKVIVFGDLHSEWRALSVILSRARHFGIDNAINLGDECCRFGAREDTHRLFSHLRRFRDEKQNRTLVCVAGNDSAVPGDMEDLLRNYVGLDGRRITGSLIYRNENIIAGHSGEDILQEHGKLIRDYKDKLPLVIFHGHSHSMGVLPEYKWLDEKETVPFIEEGEKTFCLEPGKVYWVNPGAAWPWVCQGKRAANFAIYDPQEQKVTLKSVFYRRH